ncbi:helix-turn-helix protein [Larkinella arboricola]|uniref:Helix-turn-helix protein n=1 Tax=Larkinella arboricola TaxID=643671 RepID=A0A327WU15_LARAB|nr:helix-turn-helix transcriptional regulator [Larkinella arboricola]RAJ92240.1 helix-turn-helix protein [Larkinella arboricola]
MNFGDRIKRLREDKKMSQDDLARLMGKKHRNVVGSWEKGKAEPSLSDIRKLAEILSTTTNYLIEGIEAAQPTVVQEVPAGYVMMKAEEVIEMQRQLLKKQGEKIEEQK